MVEAASGRRVRRLSSVEIDVYDVLAPELASRVRLVRIPKPPGPYVGITIGRFVFLTRTVPPGQTSSLLAHELVHVRQWQELGAIGFIYRYLADFGQGLRRHRSWHAAYRGIKAEQEARAEAHGWAGRGGNLTGQPPNRPDEH